MVESDFDKELLAANLLGARTLTQLYEKEKILTNAKMIALHNTPIAGELDYAHLKKIHYFLFEYIYTWAGQDRYEADIRAVFGKGHTRFTPYDKLPAVSKALFDALKTESYFEGQGVKHFAKSAAVFMNGLNILHPFREGNGRVQRIFMQYLGQRAGHRLSFKEISEREMIQASIQGARGNLYVMEQLFQKALR